VQALQLRVMPADLQGETKQALKLETRLPELRQAEAKVEQLPCRYSWLVVGLPDSRTSRVCFECSADRLNPPTVDAPVIRSGARG
jgi:hypothetical protein